jgi:16S rRNA (uracil1498-N3)-methyltransferase
MSKKMHRFLQKTAEPALDQITDPDIVHQIRSVLKLRPGESVGLFASGGAERVVQIEDIRKDCIIVAETAQKAPPLAPRRIVRAAIAITKRDHFELVVQKLSELGISEIIPLITDRTIKTGLRIDRLQAISDEAIELSGGTKRVAIYEPLSPEQALERFPDAWILFEEGGGSKVFPETSCTFAIGPEGGWSEREHALFMAKGASVCSLAPRTLRAETAAILAGYELLWE